MLQLKIAARLRAPVVSFTTRRRCPQQTLNRCSMFTLLGNGFCRDRVCNSVVCSHSWTTTDLCTDNTTHCDSLCSAATDCRAYSVATQPPPTHPGACHALGKARCILYSGTAYAAGLFSQPLVSMLCKIAATAAASQPAIAIAASRLAIAVAVTAAADSAACWRWTVGHTAIWRDWQHIECWDRAGCEWRPRARRRRANLRPIYCRHLGRTRARIAALKSRLPARPRLGACGRRHAHRRAHSLAPMQCDAASHRLHGARIGLLTDCGGLLHTSPSGRSETRFYERLDCVNPGRDTNGHSLMVGSAYDGKAPTDDREGIRPPSSDLLPSLDVCGGHFGLVLALLRPLITTTLATARHSRLDASQRVKQSR